jgi:DNA-binding GntR family transcriptional regulator
MSNASTLKQKAYMDIRSRIESGHLSAGTRLSEVSLSKELRISRTPIREAIHQLASEGVVEHIPHYGSFVKQLSAEELEGLFSLRETLECYAIERGVKYINDSDLLFLDRLCMAMREMVRTAMASPDGTLSGAMAHEWVTNDSLFHMVLINAARNPWLLKIVDDMKLMTRMFGQRREPLSAGNLARIYAGHSRIVRALRKGDVDRARDELGKHIHRGCRLVLEMVGASSEGDSSSRFDLEAWPPEVRDYVRRIEKFEVEKPGSGGSQGTT